MRQRIYGKRGARANNRRLIDNAIFIRNPSEEGKGKELFSLGQWMYRVQSCWRTSYQKVPSFLRLYSYSTPISEGFLSSVSIHISIVVAR